MIRPALISLTLAATPAWADYACAFPTECRGVEACAAGDVRVSLHFGQDGWVMTGLFEGQEQPMGLHPDAGTYFAHVFIGVDGYEDGMDAMQLSVAREGTAFLSLHSMGYRPEASTYHGRCEVVR